MYYFTRQHYNYTIEGCSINSSDDSWSPHHLIISLQLFDRFCCHNTKVSIFRTHSYILSGRILPVVRVKCPRFLNCLRNSKYEINAFSNSAGYQKWPALSESEQRSMVELSLKVGEIVPVDKKDKAYIHCAIIIWYVTYY